MLAQAGSPKVTSGALPVADGGGQPRASMAGCQAAPEKIAANRLGPEPTNSGYAN